MTAKENIGEPPEDSSNESIPIEDLSLQDTDLEAIQAYQQLSHELDEINNFLDALEKKNNNLSEELLKLLEESKQIRSELKEVASSSDN